MKETSCSGRAKSETVSEWEGMFHERKLIKADGSMRQICCHMMMSLVRTTFRQKRRQKVEWARLIQRGRGETMQREEEEKAGIFYDV